MRTLTGNALDAASATQRAATADEALGVSTIDRTLLQTWGTPASGWTSASSAGPGVVVMARRSGLVREARSSGASVMTTRWGMPG
jgi:hypothetical protein